MSRHIIPNAPGAPETRVTVVGWDAPLETFWGQAYDHLEYDEEPVFWFGDSPCEIPTIPDLAKALAEHGVDLPVEVAAALGRDYQREGSQFAGRPATGLIAAMSTMYAGPKQAARISAALTSQDQAAPVVSDVRECGATDGPEHTDDTDACTRPPGHDGDHWDTYGFAWSSTGGAE